MTYIVMIGKLFKKHQKRLNVLDERVRSAAMAYAEEFYSTRQCTKEEALERGIAKAELKKRNL